MLKSRFRTAAVAASFSVASLTMLANAETLPTAGEIRLFNLNGTLVRAAINGMSLENIPHGIYIAKGAGALVRVDIR